MAGWVILGALMMVMAYVHAQSFRGAHRMPLRSAILITIGWYGGVLAVTNGALGMILQ